MTEWFRSFSNRCFRFVVSDSKKQLPPNEFAKALFGKLVRKSSSLPVEISSQDFAHNGRLLTSNTFYEPPEKWTEKSVRALNSCVQI